MFLDLQKNCKDREPPLPASYIAIFSQPELRDCLWDTAVNCTSSFVWISTIFPSVFSDSGSGLGPRYNFFVVFVLTNTKALMSGVMLYYIIKYCLGT